MSGSKFCSPGRWGHQFDWNRLWLMMWFVLGWLSVLGEIGRVQLTPHLSLRWLDAWAGVLVIGFWLKQGPNFWRRQIWWWVVAVVIGLSWLARRWHGQPFFVSGVWYAVRLMVYLGLIPVVKQLIAQAQTRVSWQTGVSVLTGMMVLSGWLQYWLLPDLHFLFRAGYDPHLYRMTGWWWDPNFFALELILIWWWYLPDLLVWLTGVSGRHWRGWMGVLVLISLGLTYSRAGYLTWLLLTLGLTIWLRWRKLGLMWLMWAGLIYYWLPRLGGEGVNLARTASITGRLFNWRQALLAWSDSPLLGIGYNFFQFYAPVNDPSRPMHARFGVDNSWLLIAVTTGLLGAVYSLHLMLTYLINCWRQTQAWLDYPANRLALNQVNYWWPILGILSLLTMLLGSSFSNALFYPPLMVWWTALVAVGLKESKKV